MRYSIEPRDQIFVKCYEFLPFAKNMGNILEEIKVKIQVGNTFKNSFMLLHMHLKLFQENRRSNSKNSRSNWQFNR